MNRNVNLIPAMRGISPVYGKDDPPDQKQRRQKRKKRKEEREEPRSKLPEGASLSRYA